MENTWKTFEFGVKHYVYSAWMQLEDLMNYEFKRSGEFAESWEWQVGLKAESFIAVKMHKMSSTVRK